jgi:hypothetical protein
VSAQGRRGPQPRKIKTASPPTSIYVAYHTAADLSRPARGQNSALDNCFTLGFECCEVTPHPARSGW